MESLLPIFDTHSHLDFPEFDADRKTLLSNNIIGVVIPGIDVTSCKRILDITAYSERLYAAVGIHPNHTADSAVEDWQIISALAHRDDVIAIGETGLDRYWVKTPFEIQMDMFHRHIELSHETRKPILIHCRDAWNDLLPILRRTSKLCGVIHAFGGNTEHMLECVELGLFISFAGSVTYRNTKFSALWEAAEKTPSDRLLIETDAPFMIPHPLRGKLSRNDPTFAALIIQRLAEIRNISPHTLAEVTVNNARRLFGL